MAEALEKVPGLHVTATENRMNTMFSVRGIRTAITPQILVLLDGINISELTAFATNYSFRYPVNFIERIEIIRGPGSAVYGADAFSGVINIMTKSPGNTNSFEVGANVGSFNYVETWLNGNVAVDELKVGFSVTHEEMNSDDDRLTPYGVMARDRELDNIHVNATYGVFFFKN